MRKRIIPLVLIFIALSCLLFAIKSVYYQINQEQCRGCGRCTIACVPQAIQFNEQTGGLYIDADLCTGCGACLQACPYGAIYAVTGNSDDTIPTAVLQLKSHPNPMHEYSDFSYVLPKNSQAAELHIVNSKGQLVYTREIDKTTSFRWNGMDYHGKELPNGVYFARLICGKAITSNKITLVR